MANAKYQQLQTEMEELITPEEKPPEYEDSTFQPTFPGVQHLQQPMQKQNIVHVNNSVPCPRDYLGLAIFVTLCCCLPFGIVAIIRSGEVRTQAASGNYAGAKQASQSARNWSLAGIATGVVLLVVWIVIQVSLVSTGVYNDGNLHYK